MRARLSRRGRFAALAVCAAAVGCGGGEPPTEDAPDTGAAEFPAAAGALEPGIQRVTGFVAIGQERRDFVPCAGGEPYWLDGPALPEILELHAVLTPGMEPVESIFLDLLAAPGSPPASGPGAGLAGRLDALEVRRAAFEGWGCREVDQTLVAEARGNEPFWRLEVTEAGATFATPEGERPFEAARPEPSPEGWRLTGTTDAGEPFTLVLDLTGCVDSMSGAWSHVTARLELPDRVLEGCGVLGARGEA